MKPTTGCIAELKVALRASEKGFTVSKPLLDSCRYDLIIDDNERLWKAQVKYTEREASNSDGAIFIDFRSTTKQTQCYTAKEIDVIILYSPKTDSFYWLPSYVWDGKTSITLRVNPTKNGQTKNCLFANQFIW